MPRRIDDLDGQGGLSGTDIADITGASPATVSLRKIGTVRPRSSVPSILSELHSIVGCLSRYHEPHQVRAWLYAPHPQLDGKRAIDLIAENRSVDVLRILDRLDADASL